MADTASVARLLLRGEQPPKARPCDVLFGTEQQPQQRSSTVRQRMLTAAELSEILTKAHPKTLGQLDVRRTCAYCARVFTERKNIGQWRCAYHTGRLEPSRDGSMTCALYSCCGKARYSRGCRHADHAEQMIYTVPSDRHLLVLPQCFIVRSENPRPGDLRLASADLPLMHAQIELPDVEAMRVMLKDDANQWQWQEFRHEDEIQHGLDEERYINHVTESMPVLVMRTDMYGLLDPQQ